MRKKLIIPVLAMMLIVGFCASTLAGGYDHKTPKKDGIQCVPILKGTAEYDVFVDIWIDHPGGPLSHFE
jgi:hypothetical protein